MALSYHKFNLLYSQIRFVFFSKPVILYVTWRQMKSDLKHFSSISLSHHSYQASCYFRQLTAIETDIWWFVYLVSTYETLAAILLKKPIIFHILNTVLWLSSISLHPPGSSWNITWQKGCKYFHPYSKHFRGLFKNLPDIQGCISSVDKFAIRYEIITTTRYSNSLNSLIQRT